MILTSDCVCACVRVCVHKSTTTGAAFGVTFKTTNVTPPCGTIDPAACHNNTEQLSMRILTDNEQYLYIY